jgi:hypothetical protein
VIVWRRDGSYGGELRRGFHRGGPSEILPRRTSLSVPLEQSLQSCSLNTSIQSFSNTADDMAAPQDSNGLTLTVLGSGKSTFCLFGGLPREACDNGI